MPEALYPDLKRCCTCKEFKPSDSYYRASTRPDGLRPQCKDCLKRWRAEHKEQFTEQQRRYRQKSRARDAIRERAYRDANRERIAEKRREYVQRPEVQERYREGMRRRQAENPNRRRENTQRRREENPERFRALGRVSNHKRRASEGTFTAEEWLTLCEKYGNRCLCCGRDDLPLTVDHVVPICKGGTNWITDLQPLCSPCNIRKRCKIIDYRPEHQPVVQAALF